MKFGLPQKQKKPQETCQTLGIEIRENRLIGDFFQGQMTITSPHPLNTPTPPPPLNQQLYCYI